jgi:DNA-binding MarR family transcriptional regulator
VLDELAHRDAPTAADLGRDLGLDAGYLSRILRRFETRGFIARRPSAADERQSLVRLTRKGRAALAPLEARARGAVETLLGRIAGPAQRQVVEAMGTIERLLDAPHATADRAALYLLRPHQPGDIGWVIQRHGAIYAREWGYNAAFEALVARICADFLDRFDPARERCWTPSATAPASARCSWCRSRRRSPGCGCCWWSRRHAGSASAGG